MKLLFDFFPIVAFFVTYKIAPDYADRIQAVIALDSDLIGIVCATAVLIIFSVAQIAYMRLTHRPVSKTALFSTVLVVIFGGLTIALRKPEFIMAKPTILYWFFAAVLVSFRLRGKNLMQSLLGQFQAPDAVWERVLRFTVGFLVVLGALNLAVAWLCPMDIWVDFKLFGLLGLTLLFAFGLAFYLARYVQEGKNAS